MTNEQIYREYTDALNIQFAIRNQLIEAEEQKDYPKIIELKNQLQESKNWCVAIDSQRKKVEK